MSTSPTPAVEHFGPEGLHQHRDELLRVYSEVYETKLVDPFYSVHRYWERLEGYASRDGFSLVIETLGGVLVGYALGYTLPVGSSWWRGLLTPVDQQLLDEDGKRTFALTEIMILASWRRRGYARVLHDALITARTEKRATLLVLPDNEPARAAYASWGWYKLGALRPFRDAPTCDAMILDLNEAT